MKEEQLEAVCLSWLADTGYEITHGEHISPGGNNPLRARYTEVVLAPRLRDAVVRLNPDLTGTEVDQVVEKLATYSAQSIVEGNRETYDWIRNGVPLDRVEPDGRRVVLRVKVIDFDGPNDLLAVQQFTVKGQKPRRPDIVLFINGLPLVVIELKNPADPNADIESAFNQIENYKADVPQLFYFNLFNVISDGTVAKYGSLTAGLNRYSYWRILGGEKVRSGLLQLEVLVRGLLTPDVLLPFLRGFVAFGGSHGGASFKIVAQWHQYHGVIRAVERAVDALLRKKDGKGGVIWFTQGSGKSLLALFYVMALRERPEFQNPTVVLVTDRNDLDGQLFDTFSDCRWSLGATPEQADDRDDLRAKLNGIPAGGVFLTTINKFAPDPGATRVEALSDRSNIVVITDEAHRSQYGFKAKLDQETGRTQYGLAKYMRDALPNAIYLGMTGTPISLDDKDTEAVFGTYVDVYDMLAAQEDEAVVPLSYESRIIELRFNEAEKQTLVDEFLEQTDDDTEQRNRTVSRLTRLESLAMADGRLEALAADLVNHWESRKEAIAGKAMIVAISREAAVRLFDAVVRLRPEWSADALTAGRIKVVMTGSSSDPPHFRPHRTDKRDRKLLEKRFKDADDELELVIVRDMWLTGFDAPPAHTLYIDKPMQGHGLMQAIARVNRVWRDKPGGLIVDYIGVGEELKKAIRAYTQGSGGQRAPVDVSGEALKILLDTLDVLRKEFFHEFDYSGFTDPARALALLAPAMDHILTLDPTVDEKGRNVGVQAFMDQVVKLTKAQALAGTRPEAVAHREEIAFFQAVRVSIMKLTKAGAGGMSRLEREAALRQLVAKGVLVDGVNDLYQTLGLEKPDISLLDDRFLDQIRTMPTRNLAAELLKRLIEDQIKERGRKNAVQAKDFTEKLEAAIRRYQNRGLTTVEVIEELIKIAHEINEARPPEDLSEEEFAFYQALIENESATRELGHPVLKALALELTDKLRKSATIDWQNRQSARARMVNMVKILLRKHRYPPDKSEEATARVIEQAELLADNWAFELG